ncbi:MAG: aminoglycoside phosphotransferase family protein [Chloroflexota bacterium]
MSLDHYLRSLVAGLAGDAQNIQIKKRPPLDIQSNALFDVYTGQHRWIAKVYLKEAEYDSAPLTEYRNLKRLAPHGLAPTPIAHFAYDGMHQPVVIYDYIDGEMVDRRPLTVAEMRDFAEMWVRLNRLPTDGLWHSRRWDEFLPERFAYWDSVYAEYIAWAKTHMPQAVEPVQEAYALYETHADTLATINPHALPADTLCHCHADPRFANLIQRPDGSFVYVDWEDGGLRDPAFVIGNMMVQPNQEDLLSKAHWDAFLDVYCAGMGYARIDFEARVNAYKIGTALLWFGGLLRFLAHKADNGEHVGFRINGMPANQRLRRYLARCMATVGDATMDDLLAQYEVAGLCFVPEK